MTAKQAVSALDDCIAIGEVFKVEVLWIRVISFDTWRFQKIPLKLQIMIVIPNFLFGLFTLFEEPTKVARENMAYYRH